MRAHSESLPEPTTPTIPERPIEVRAEEKAPPQEVLFRQALLLLKPVAAQLWLRCGRRVELDELIGIGLVALVRAVRAYDPSQASFRPYITKRLEWAIVDGIRRYTRYRRRRPASRDSRVREGSGETAADPAGGHPQRAREEPVSSARGTHRAFGTRRHRSPRARHGVVPKESMEWAVDIDIPSSIVDPAESPEEQLSRSQDARSLRCAVARLPSRQRALVQGHYFKGARFDHIAARLGISKSRACRLHGQALRSLRRDLLRTGLLTQYPA